MKNLLSLLSFVEPIKHYSLFGNNKVIISNEILTGREIYYIFEHIKWMECHHINSETTISLRCTAFKSSDVVSVIEILMLYCSLNLNNKIKFVFEKRNVLKNNILYHNSLLPKFNGRFLNNGYSTSFYKTIYSPTQYRRFLKCNGDADKEMCVVNDDIKYTLQNSGINYELACEAAESIAEIVGNAIEHSEADCLIDVKVCKNISDKMLVSLNVISLSCVFVGTKLIDLINKKQSNYSGSEIVFAALPNHTKVFDETYDFSSFAFVCSFQNTVSTRNNIINSGGTGFTTLLKNIHNKSFNKEYDSYILSGNNTLYFRNEYLNVNEKGLIGFNDENDFYNKRPNDSILKKEKVTFPGTIFCVNLITENENHENG